MSVMTKEPRSVWAILSVAINHAYYTDKIDYSEYRRVLDWLELSHEF